MFLFTFLFTAACFSLQSNWSFLSPNLWVAGATICRQHTSVGHLWHNITSNCIEELIFKYTYVVHKDVFKRICSAVVVMYVCMLNELAPYRQLIGVFLTYECLKARSPRRRPMTWRPWSFINIGAVAGWPAICKRKK